LIDFDYSELMDDEGTSNDDVGTKELCSDGNVSDDGDGNGSDDGDGDGSDDGDGDGSDDGDGDGSDDEDDDQPLWTVRGFYRNSPQRILLKFRLSGHTSFYGY
jgi:hypothetical protein